MELLLLYKRLICQAIDILSLKEQGMFKSATGFEFKEWSTGFMTKYVDLYPICLARDTLKHKDNSLTIIYYFLFESRRLQEIRKKVYDLVASDFDNRFMSHMDLSRPFYLTLGYSGKSLRLEKDYLPPLDPEACVMGLDVILPEA